MITIRIIIVIIMIVIIMIINNNNNNTNNKYYPLKNMISQGVKRIQSEIKKLYSYCPWVNRNNNNSSTSNIVDNDSNCLHHTSDCNESSSFLKDRCSTHVDSKVFFNGLNGHKFYYNSSQDKIGFIPHNTDDISVPPQFQIPSSCHLNMNPHELELVLFINENILSPSIFNKVMKWARSATANGYKFNSPSYSTLKKQNKWTTHSPILLM